MANKRLIWVKKPPSLTYGVIDKIIVGYITESCLDVKEKFMPHFNLPGFKKPSKYFEKEDEAKEYIENLFILWKEKVL